jgi:hypothetical protein
VLLPLLLPLSLRLQAAAADPALIQIGILEGNGQVYAPGSRATRGVTVQVTGETGQPVEGATVTFQLPPDGPGGVFSNGSRIEIATTGADGRATVWGMQWNRTLGSFEIRITASKGQAHAGTVCPQYLAAAPPAETSAARGPAGANSAPSASAGHGGHKWLWVALVAAGAAGAGVSAAARSMNTHANATPASVTTIGIPTISLGHP